jgi:hypothetical protein
MPSDALDSLVLRGELIRRSVLEVVAIGYDDGEDETLQPLRDLEEAGIDLPEVTYPSRQLEEAEQVTVHADELDLSRPPCDYDRYSPEWLAWHYAIPARIRARPDFEDVFEDDVGHEVRWWEREARWWEVRAGVAAKETALRTGRRYKFDFSPETIASIPDALMDLSKEQINLIEGVDAGRSRVDEVLCAIDPGASDRVENNPESWWSRARKFKADTRGRRRCVAPERGLTLIEGVPPRTVNRMPRARERGSCAPRTRGSRRGSQGSGDDPDGESEPALGRQCDLEPDGGAGS